VTVQIIVVNDNSPELFLSQDVVNITRDYVERQSYIAGQPQILLHNRLFIRDGDVGDRVLTEARVSVVGSKYIKMKDWVC